MVERARPEAGGDGTREYGGGNMPTSAVRTEDQQRSHHERDREADLVEHSTKQGPLEHLFRPRTDGQCVFHQPHGPPSRDRENSCLPGRMTLQNHRGT